MTISSALGIIGFPIGHSISPVFQQAALDRLSIGAEYRRTRSIPVMWERSLTLSAPMTSAAST